MMLLNFGHPITEEQKEQIRYLTGKSVREIIEIKTQFDHQLPFTRQINSLVEEICFPSLRWQTEPLLINLPSFNVIAALLIAELHGRMGYFPPILRLKPVEGSLPPRFAVAEVINLQNIRETAREKR